jgi:hypothetical protein
MHAASSGRRRGRGQTMNSVYRFCSNGKTLAGPQTPTPQVAEPANDDDRRLRANGTLAAYPLPPR